MALSSKFAVSVDAMLTNPLDLTTASAPIERRIATRMLTGTGAGQADKMWSDTRSLGPSAAEDLDLAGTGLLDPLLGTAITFLRIKGIFVQAAAANLNNLSIGANVVNGWATLFGPTGASGGTVTLRPGGWFAACCGTADATGWAVTGGTGDLLHAVNLAGTNTISYDVVVVGCSA